MNDISSTRFAVPIEREFGLEIAKRAELKILRPVRLVNSGAYSYYILHSYSYNMVTTTEKRKISEKKWDFVI